MLAALVCLPAIALASAAATQSWAALFLATGLLLPAPAVALLEVRRTQAALRSTQCRMADCTAAVERSLRSRLDRLERSQVSLAASRYQNHRPGGLRWPVKLVSDSVRTLLNQGDVLDAYTLVADAGTLDSLDRRTLGQLHTGLKRRGYLRSALEVARARAELTGADADLREVAFLEGETKVLSGQPVPTVRHEGVPFRPHPGRILHLVGSSLPGKQTGYTIRTQYLASAQRDAGLDPQVATQSGVQYEGGDHVSEEVDGVTYHRLPGPGRGSVPLDEWMRRNVAEVAHLVRAVRPAVLHAASDFINARTAEVVGKAYSIPVVYESRGFWEETWLSNQVHRFGWDLDQLVARHGLPDVYLWRRATEDRSRSDADHVITLAGVMADRIHAGGVPRDRITVVPNGVDTDAFPVLPSRNRELARQLGIGDDTAVVGYVSSLSEYEGLDTLISAYAMVKDTAPTPVALLIVGDGRKRDDLTRQAAALGVDVVFPGQVPHDAVLDYYSLIDIFVVPRKPAEVCHLVTPLKPYEAFSTGRTVVLSDVRALTEIAYQSQAAELFEAGNEVSLASTLAALLKDPERRQELATAGAAWVRGDRTWAANARTYLGVYDRLGATAHPA